MPDLLRFDETTADIVNNYGAHDTRSVHLGSGSGPSHMYVLHFAPGGFIGPHETGFGQLFAVTSGEAWVDIEGDRVEVPSGQAVAIPRGVQHSKGSVNGAMVVMVQILDLEGSSTVES